MKGKRILLCVTGGIAAYKSTFLLRLLVKAGARVQVVFSPAAHTFVTPLTFSTLSGNPVLSAFQDDSGNWVNHVELGMKNDLMIVAPCTAKTLSAMAQGFSDNLITASYLSARCPVLIAPAMDIDMWKHASVQRNVQTLLNDGVNIVEPETGYLASGLEGKGRMAEPEQIMEKAQSVLAFKNSGKWALVTAGPTYEAIDPVRFIGNHSSGKMGVAIAKALRNAGYSVHLVCGPGVIPPDEQQIEIHSVTDAREMYACCLDLFPSSKIIVMAAAVADFRPMNAATEKLKKGSEDGITIELTKNPDILKSLGAIKHKDQILAGFALETENGRLNALKKLKEKNADFIFLNVLNRKEGVSFGSEKNKVTVFSLDGKVEELPLMEKEELATFLVNKMLNK